MGNFCYDCQDVTKCLLSVTVRMCPSECRVRVCKADAHQSVCYEHKWGRRWACLLECVFMCVLGGHVMSVVPGVDKDGVMVGPQLSFWTHWVGFGIGDAF